jgi:hypothetical protein
VKNGEAVSIATTSHNLLEENASRGSQPLFASDATCIAKNAKAIRILDYPESKVGGGWRVWKRSESRGYLFEEFGSL